jgi:hypothetical protein
MQSLYRFAYARTCICRCEELKKKLASNEEELKWVNEQLLMAVQQKFKLQQQIEDWQVYNACMD